MILEILEPWIIHGVLFLIFEILEYSKMSRNTNYK